MHLCWHRIAKKYPAARFVSKQQLLLLSSKLTVMLKAPNPNNLASTYDSIQIVRLVVRQYAHTTYAHQIFEINLVVFRERA